MAEKRNAPKGAEAPDGPRGAGTPNPPAPRLGKRAAGHRRRLPHIGARKVKSAAAVFVSFWVWQGVRLVWPELEVHPIFMYMYSVLEMRDSWEKTADLGALRIRSTLIALAAGLCALTLEELVRPWFAAAWMQTGWELALVTAGVLVTLTVAERAGCGSFCGLAAAVFTVLVVSPAGKNPWLYALLRSFQTAAGVCIAWVINVALWPYPKRRGRE